MSINAENVAKIGPVQYLLRYSVGYVDFCRRPIVQKCGCYPRNL